jgi:mitochondrial enoyl-[acyl-carrier protein] reductase / trans-2-enoyl-CoA reductase
LSPHRPNLSARFDSFGSPEEVLQAVEQPRPDPGPGQILLRMLRAPVNPADLNLIQGTYGVRPPLPSTAGIEGIGEVEALGPGVTGWNPGQRAVPLKAGPTWQRWLAADADRCFPVPDRADPAQAAMLSVNPSTAWRMLHDFTPLPPGAWIVQNAANSGVGRCVIAIARALGWHTANLVRRPELIPELQQLGADLVVADDENAAGAITKAVRDPVRLALNAVGGNSALTLAKVIAPGSTLVTYGGMSRQPISISTGQLIFKDLRFAGFWMTRWYETATRAQVGSLWNPLLDLIADGKLHTPVARVFPLSQVREAAAAAAQSGRAGKIQLDLTA